MTISQFALVDVLFQTLNVEVVVADNIGNVCEFLQRRHAHIIARSPICLHHVAGRSQSGRAVVAGHVWMQLLDPSPVGSPHLSEVSPRVDPRIATACSMLTTEPLPAVVEAFKSVPGCRRRAPRIRATR